MAIGNMHKKFGEDWVCSSEGVIADRQTHTHMCTHTHTHSSQYSAPLQGRSKKLLKYW